MRGETRRLTFLLPAWDILAGSSGIGVLSFKHLENESCRMLTAPLTWSSPPTEMSRAFERRYRSPHAE